MATPQLRVIVDWADDAFFVPTTGSEPLNIVPTPLSHALVDVVGFSTGTYTTVAEVTDYGIMTYRCVTGTGVFGGMRWGTDGSTIDDIAISASTTYRLTMWVKGVASYSGINVAINVHDQGGTSLGGSGNFTLTADWVQKTFTFTSGVGDTHARVEMVKANNATNITFDAAGLMITAGTGTVTVFNTGNAYDPYEDISADVMQASWSLDMDVKKRTPREGTLTLVVDNSTRKYSPRYASSPLYGAFKHGLRVRVDVKRVSTSAWVSMWYGWLTGYDVTPGRTIGDKQAVLTASQGIFNLDAAPLQDNLQENVTLDAVLPNILMAGWYPPSTPYVFIADVSTAGDTAWTPSVDDFIPTLNTGITEFPLVGDGWSDTDTRATKVLQQLMEVEQGWLYLDREARMNFRSRDSIIWNTAADYTVNLDTDGKPMEYIFAPGEISAVSLTYYPSGESENQILWTRRGTKRVRARDSSRVDAKFQYEEGEKITVKSINAFGDGGNDSTISAVDAGGNTYDTRHYYATVDLRNGKGVITIYNQGPTEAYFSLTLKGTIEVNADSEQVQVVSDTGNILRNVPINNKLLKDEDTATDLGNYIISQNSSDYDEFRAFEVISRDSTWLDRALNIEPGHVLSISEYQTAVSSKKHVCIGANHVWQPGQLRSTFRTTRVDETEYWVLGTSELSHETVLAY